MRKIFSLFGCIILSININAQNTPTEVDKLRTESGVDPTRINSRAGYSLMYYTAQDNNRSIVTNRLNLTLGVNRWSFSVKPDITSVNDGISGFQTGLGDVKFNILNAFYVSDQYALAGSVEFGLPFAKAGYGSPYFSVTPSFVFSYTINPGFILAVQPQYSFALEKSTHLPDLNMLTVRAFLAKFTKTGYFFVFEPRPSYDFENKSFDLIISPIVGKSLGGGFNLIGLMEVPVKKETIDQRGILFQVGFNKNF
ncbi:hypothetical protein F3J23_18635 [Chryseobacterium sp. Tr-659]|uniref:hypothetical protein n=1 Tax=Chryseobacterium sp. Tr-659 TaxID=2608340 RepID=UPI0014208C79|nr:hypothetical protein [Chryseobacterium sp. Tr-659]NIF07441.1 hypothetical protein [Chryseobacterium sp. Tr-659]